MISIVRATVADDMLLADLGRQTFIESHGHSAPQKDIDTYATEKFSVAAMTNELSDPKNIYHIIYYADDPAGFSKIIFNCAHPLIKTSNVTKLERLYLLERFHKLRLGSALFEFNVKLSKANDQTAMWLYVWKENAKAIKFYLRHNFKIIGSYDFRLSPTHTNPNHQMLLVY
jgi:ribosomal protein S18 acetylase RimI-like enzyme